MAVQGPWVGSSAVAETGQRWMSTAGSQLRLGLPFWMSQMVGVSKEFVIELGADHNYNKDWLIGTMRAQGSTPIVINVRGDIVSYSPLYAAFEFPGDLANAYVQLNIHGVTVYGRGGTGAGGSNKFEFMDPAQNGGVAIANWIGGRLRIDNGGAIAGGGGGGAGSYWSSSGVASGGGGGRPFGMGGQGFVGQSNPAAEWSNGVGANGSLSGPGGGGRYNNSRRNVWGGTGGDVAQPGGRCSGNFESNTWGNPGQGGAAVIGTSPTWHATGAIYGAWL